MLNSLRRFRLLRNSIEKSFKANLGYYLNSKIRKVGCLLLATSPVLAQETKLATPDPNTLTHSYLIKNACQSAVDSTSTLFHQTVAALLDAEQEYALAIYTLIKLLEYHLEALKLSQQEQDTVWDLIIAQKQDVKEKKQSKEDLELLYQSVETVVNSLSQTAFLAGTDKAAIQSGEQVFSVQTHLKSARKTTQEAEIALSEMDVKVINVTAKHDERQKNKEEITENESESNDETSIPLEIEK